MWRGAAVKAKVASEFREQAKVRAASGQRDRAHRAEQEVGDLRVTTAALENKVEQAAAANEKLTRALKEAEQQVEELRKERDLLQARARSLEKAQGKGAPGPCFDWRDGKCRRGGQCRFGAATKLDETVLGDELSVWVGLGL